LVVLLNVIEIRDKCLAKKSVLFSRVLRHVTALSDGVDDYFRNGA
jgi:hypothetical protein